MCFVRNIYFHRIIITLQIYAMEQILQNERAHRSTTEADGHTASEAATPVPQLRSGQATIPGPILPGAPSNCRDDTSPRQKHAVYAFQGSAI